MGRVTDATDDFPVTRLVLVRHGESEPEQAAWTMVANVLLNLDEAITKE